MVKALGVKVSVLPDLFEGYTVRPVESYCHQLLRNLRWLAPEGVEGSLIFLRGEAVLGNGFGRDGVGREGVGHASAC